MLLYIISNFGLFCPNNIVCFEVCSGGANLSPAALLSHFLTVLSQNVISCFTEHCMAFGEFAGTSTLGKIVALC